MANIKRANTSGITKSGVAIPDVPDAPTIGAATNVGTSRAFNNGSATVAFTANPRGGTSTSFTATSTPGSFTATGAGSPLTVTGLQSATSYTFAVTGTNASATGAASAASSSITATTVPQAPTIGTPNKTGLSSIGQVNVLFTAGSSGGSTITSYTATSTPGGFTGTGSTSPITVSGLTAGTSYTFTVTATNANGVSAASGASASIAATQYSCAVGTVSGSNCTYTATATTTYFSPGCSACGGQPYAEVRGCGQWLDSTFRVECCYGTNGCASNSCYPTCSSSLSYSCPSGGTLSGTTCTVAAGIS